jgi:hypothetical protein
MRQTSRPLSSRGAVSAGRNSGTRTRIAPPISCLKAIASVGVHTLAMLSVTAAIAATVYEWVRLEVLRRARLNIDALWVTAVCAEN